MCWTLPRNSQCCHPVSAKVGGSHGSSKAFSTSALVSRGRTHQIHENPIEFDEHFLAYHPYDPCMLYMVTFTINIPPMLAYIPYMDPMGYTMIPKDMSPIFRQFGWLYSPEIFRDPAIRRVSSFSAGTMMVAPGFLGSNVGTVRRSGSKMI